jgi:hypothetical protein
MENNAATVIVITGRTRDGRPFRPSDWAQRLALAASAGSCPAERPMCFHRRVHVGEVTGVPAVVIDSALELEDPALFRYLMEFARMHDLEWSLRTAEEAPAPLHA